MSLQQQLQATVLNSDDFQEQISAICYLGPLA